MLSGDFAFWKYESKKGNSKSVGVGQERNLWRYCHTVPYKQNLYFSIVYADV